MLTKEFICACFLAALSDIRLLNGSTVTLTFSRELSTATFDVEFICDGIVELDQRCTLDFDPPNSRFVTQGGPAEVEIAECEDDCEFVEFLADLSECRLYSFHF